jgi:hypothetical protein
LYLRQHGPLPNYQLNSIDDKVSIKAKKPFALQRVLYLAHFNTFCSRSRNHGCFIRAQTDPKKSKNVRLPVDAEAQKSALMLDALRVCKDTPSDWVTADIEPDQGDVPTKKNRHPSTGEFERNDLAKEFSHEEIAIH